MSALDRPARAVAAAPRDAAGVAAVLRRAAARGQTVRAQVGAADADADVVLRLDRLDALVELDPVDRVAVCGPALPAGALAAAAAPHGLAPGPVIGCEVVLATGERLRAGGRLVKDNAGYDLVRLLCRGAGVLAVPTELTLRLRPAAGAPAPADAPLLDAVAAGGWPGDAMAAGGGCARAVGGVPAAPSPAHAALLERLERAFDPAGTLRRA